MNHKPNLIAIWQGNNLVVRILRRTQKCLAVAVIIVTSSTAWTSDNNHSSFKEECRETNSLWHVFFSVTKKSASSDCLTKNHQTTIQKLDRNHKTLSIPDDEFRAQLLTATSLLQKESQDLMFQSQGSEATVYSEQAYTNTNGQNVIIDNVRGYTTITE